MDARGIASENALVQRRQAQRCADETAKKILGRSPGITDSPIIEAPRSASECLCDMLSVLKQIRDKASGIPGFTKGCTSFMVPGPNVQIIPVPSFGGLPTVVGTVLINEGYEGFLESFGVNVYPAANFQDVTFQLRLGADPSPKFSSASFMSNTLSTPLPFKMFIPPGQNVSIYAINNGTVKLDVSSVLCGYMKPL